VDASAITKVTSEGPDETENIGGAALEELDKQVLEKQSADIDGVSGATVTSNGYKEALALAMAQAKGEEVTSGELSFAPGTYEGHGTGYGGDVTLSVTFSEDAITGIEVVSNNETEYVGTPAFDIMFQEIQDFTSTGVDSLSGATFTSNGILAAVEDAASQAGCDIQTLRAGKIPYEVAPGADIEETYDVIVVGAGGAGVTAAAEIAQQGATVCIVEKNAEAGGNTLVAGCSFQAVYDYQVWDPKDPDATTGVCPYDGQTYDKSKSDMGRIDTLRTILNWSEEPFNEAVDASAGKLTVEEYDLPSRGVHQEYLETLKTLKAQIQEYLDWAEPQLDAGVPESDLTVFSTKELHIFQTYYGGLRLNNDQTKWIYGDFDKVSQLVRNINTDKEWMSDQGSVFNWGVTTNTLIGCLWQRINTFQGGTIENVEGTGKYACYFAVPLNTVAQANEGNSVMYRTTATKLLTDGDGRVNGIEAVKYDGTKVTLHANKGVILATGGFGANIDMVISTNDYWNKDELSSAILTTNRNCATGEGITMAQDVGAVTTGMEFTQLMPLGWADDGKLAGGKGENVIFVSPAGTDNEGKRFVDESAERDVLSQGQLTYGGKGGLTVQVMNGGDNTAANNREGKEYFCTLKEACEMTGIDYDTLYQTIIEYDKAYLDQNLAELEVPKSSATDTIGRYDEAGNYIEDTMLSIRYLAPSTHHTMGGLVVDNDRHVLDADNQPIPGLWAAGEVTGGIFAGNRLGGNAISEIIVSGRIAAKSVMSEN
jgi:fumarate reductase flavoprotein subunit